MVEKFETHLFEYCHNEQTWCLELQASSVEDAQARLAQIAQSRYLGTVQLKLPVEVGIFAKLLCWLRNRIAGKLALH